MQVPEEKTTLMHELNTPEKILENLFRRKGYLWKGMFVHFKGHDVVSHRFVDIVYLVDTDLFGLDDIFPQSFVECYLTFHWLVFRAVFDYDGLRTLLVVAWIYRLQHFCVLQFELFHVGLNFAYLQQFLLVISWVFHFWTSFVHLWFFMENLALDFRLSLSHFWFVVLSGHHICDILLLLFNLLILFFRLVLIVGVLTGRKTDLLLYFSKLWFYALNLLKKDLLHFRLSRPLAQLIDYLLQVLYLLRDGLVLTLEGNFG